MISRSLFPADSQLRRILHSAELAENCSPLAASPLVDWADELNETLELQLFRRSPQ
jgi:hypothetical protein